MEGNPVQPDAQKERWFSLEKRTLSVFFLCIRDSFFLLPEYAPIDSQAWIVTLNDVIAGI
jgi:hypothetical protein